MDIQAVIKAQSFRVLRHKRGGMWYVQRQVEYDDPGTKEHTVSPWTNECHLGEHETFHGALLSINDYHGSLGITITTGIGAEYELDENKYQGIQIRIEPKDTGGLQLWVSMIDRCDLLSLVPFNV